MCLPAVIIMVRHDRLSYDRPVFYRPAWGCDPACRGITGFPCHRNPERLWYADRGRRMRNHRKTAGWKKKEANGKLQAAACCCRWPAADCTQRYCWQVSDKLLPLLGVSEQAAPFARQYLTIAAISTRQSSFDRVWKHHPGGRSGPPVDDRQPAGDIDQHPARPAVHPGIRDGGNRCCAGDSTWEPAERALPCTLPQIGKKPAGPDPDKTWMLDFTYSNPHIGAPVCTRQPADEPGRRHPEPDTDGYGDQAIAAFSVGGKAAMLVCNGRHGNCHWHSAGAGILLGAQATGSGWPGCCVASAITAVACTSLLGGIAVCCLPPSWCICSRLTRRPRTGHQGSPGAALVTAPLAGRLLPLRQPAAGRRAGTTCDNRLYPAAVAGTDSGTAGGKAAGRTGRNCLEQRHIRPAVICCRHPDDLFCLPPQFPPRD